MSQQAAASAAPAPLAHPLYSPNTVAPSYSFGLATALTILWVGLQEAAAGVVLHERGQPVPAKQLPRHLRVQGARDSNAKGWRAYRASGMFGLVQVCAC